MNQNLTIGILKDKIQYFLEECTLLLFFLEIFSVEIWLCKTDLFHSPCLNYNSKV